MGYHPQWPSVALLLLSLASLACCHDHFTPGDLHRLKQSILQGLGLSRIPDVSKMNVSQEQYASAYRRYLELVEENRQRESQEHTTAPRFFSYTPSSEPNPHRRRRFNRHRSSHWLHFPVDRRMDLEVDHAKLRLFVCGEQAVNAEVDIRVFQVVPGERLLVDQRRLHLSPYESRWTDFDVSRVAAAWMSGDAVNMGLEVQCIECTRRGIRIATHETHGTNSSISPVLNVLANVHLDGSQARPKRDADVDLLTVPARHKCSENKKHCCKHSLTVNFKDIGFNFILHPEHFDAGYCKGRCPPRFNAANQHVLIQSLVSRNNKSVPRPCCAPSKLAPLTVIYLGENGELTPSTWQNMQVTECLCS